MTWWRRKTPGLLAGLLLCVICGEAAADPGGGPTANASGAAGVAVAAPGPIPATRVYRYFSSAGTVSFSDRPPERTPYTLLSYGCFACNPYSKVDWRATQLFRDAYASEIENAAHTFHVDPSLVRAIIHAESGFNANARSPKGALGLMQLMPTTARELGVVHPLVPGENIQGGVRYLAQMLVRFKSDVALAAAAYNAGPEAVQRHAGVPPFRETQVYVQRVRILQERYRSAGG